MSNLIVKFIKWSMTNKNKVEIIILMIRRKFSKEDQEMEWKMVLHLHNTHCPYTRLVSSVACGAY